VNFLSYIVNYVLA